MKKHYISFLLFFVLLVGVLSACTADEMPTHGEAITAIPTTTTSGPVPESFKESTPVDRETVETILSFDISYFFDEKPEQEKFRDIVRAAFDDENQKDLFVHDYLTERGMYKTTPDGVYGDGNYHADYYLNEEQNKYSFICHVNMSEVEYNEFIYCITISQEDLTKIGSLVYDLDENQNIVSEGIYTPEGQCAAYAAYEYFDGIPFPFASDYSYGYTDLENKYLYDNIFYINQRFWLEKQFATINEIGRVVGYNDDLYSWDSGGAPVYNDFAYNEKGRLIAIYEEFAEEDADTDFWEFATDITLEYREDNTLSAVEYGFYYMNYETHDRGTGDSTGKMFYDEKGRMIYKTYYMTHGSHSCFYLYENDSKRPWAYIDLGGLAQSGDDVSEYGFDVSVYLFQPSIDEVQNVHLSWQDSYAEFLKKNIPVSEVDFDAMIDGSDKEMQYSAFSAGGYPVTPFFYLYDIDKDGGPELIYIDAANGYDGDAYTYKNYLISEIGSMNFYPFGGLGIPHDKTEGLYSDVGYKGHYGEIYFYTMNNGVLTGQMVLEYNNQSQLSPTQPGLPHSFDNFTWLDYYEVTEENITKVIYEGVQPSP